MIKQIKPNIENLEKIPRKSILRELYFFYPYKKEIYENMSDTDLYIEFAQHIEKHKTKIKIGDLFNKFFGPNTSSGSPDWTQSKIPFTLINSIDGWSHINEWWIKNPKIIYKFTFNHPEKGTWEFKCSKGHLLSVINNANGPRKWVPSENIKLDDILEFQNGINWKISKIQELPAEPVFDFTIGNSSHSYYAGEHGIVSHNTGKTYLLLNAARAAQEMGYNVIWCDTEGAVDTNTFESFGIQSNKVLYISCTDTAMFRTSLSNFISSIKEGMENNLDVGKWIVFLDSLGNLATTKEKKDALEASDKKDMTKASEVKQIFRIITTDLATLHIPFIFSNHVYKDVMSFIPKNIVSGGSGGVYNPHVILMLSKAQLKENGQSEKTTGIIVTAKPDKSRFVRNNESIKFHISYLNGMNPYVGLENEVSWDKCGIEVGKLYTEKEFDKLSEAVKREIEHTKYEFEGSYLYFHAGQGRNLAVKHLGKTIKQSEQFNSSVYTQEVLEQLDVYIRNRFELPQGFISSLDSASDMKYVLDVTDDD